MSHIHHEVYDPTRAVSVPLNSSVVLEDVSVYPGVFLGVVCPLRPEGAEQLCDENIVVDPNVVGGIPAIELAHSYSSYYRNSCHPRVYVQRSTKVVLRTPPDGCEYVSGFYNIEVRYLHQEKPTARTRNVRFYLDIQE